MTIAEIEQQMQKRLNQLAAQDPVYNRLMGRLDALKEQEQDEPETD